MSWDFSMQIDAGGETPHALDGFDRNITYNVAPIFHLALGIT